MRYRKDILRGVRLAAVVFAVLLLALISYRMLHGAAAEASGETASPVVRAEAPLKPPVVHASAPDLEVPAPPSPSGSGLRPARVHKTPAPVRPAAVALAAPRIINADTEPVALPAPKPAEEIATPPPVVVATQSAPEVASATPEAPQDVPQKPAKRKRGVLRSIGHFLHIGNREVQANAMNQP
jgi:hypothetical protein